MNRADLLRSMLGLAVAPLAKHLPPEPPRPPFISGPIHVHGVQRFHLDEFQRKWAKIRPDLDRHLAAHANQHGRQWTHVKNVEMGKQID